MNPEPPPAWTNLKDVYIPNTELPLNYTIKYPCKDYHFFIHDLEQEFFEVNCTNGLWDPSPQWLGCIHPSGSKNKITKMYGLSHIFAPQNNTVPIQLVLWKEESMIGTTLPILATSPHIALRSPTLVMRADGLRSKMTMVVTQFTIQSTRRHASGTTRGTITQP